MITNQNKPGVTPLDDMAEQIKLVAKAGRDINNCKLKKKAVVILLHHITGLSQKNIVKVLDALPQLEREFLK